MAAVLDSFGVGLTFVVDGHDLLELHQHPIVVAVVSQTDRTEHERRLASQNAEAALQAREQAAREWEDDPSTVNEERPT